VLRQEAGELLLRLLAGASHRLIADFALAPRVDAYVELDAPRPLAAAGDVASAHDARYRSLDLPAVVGASVPWARTFPSSERITTRAVMGPRSRATMRPKGDERGMSPAAAVADETLSRNVASVISPPETAIRTLASR
jgi:hypothetical protein